MDGDPETKDVALAYLCDGWGAAELLWQFLRWGWAVFARSGGFSSPWPSPAQRVFIAAGSATCRRLLQVLLAGEKGARGSSIAGTAEGDQHILVAAWGSRSRSRSAAWSRSSPSAELSVRYRG